MLIELITKTLCYDYLFVTEFFLYIFLFEVRFVFLYKILLWFEFNLLLVCFELIFLFCLKMI